MNNENPRKVDLHPHPIFNDEVDHFVFDENGNYFLSFKIPNYQIVDSETLELKHETCYSKVMTTGTIIYAFTEEKHTIKEAGCLNDFVPISILISNKCKSANANVSAVNDAKIRLIIPFESEEGVNPEVEAVASIKFSTAKKRRKKSTDEITPILTNE